MEVDDKEREKNANDKTFINKLLGEMKNQFNKTEKKQISALVNFTPPNDNEVINSNSSEPIANNVEHSEVDTNPTIEPEKVDDKNDDQDTKPVIKQENVEIKPEVEAKVGDIMDVEDTPSSAIKEETDNQEENDEKPRIVLTFRKPTTNDSFKSKSKDESVSSGRRTLRAKLQIVEDNNVTLKRSPRRRSRDCNESVLQSAIARKEKSYNEASKPQRLTRQLKATPKILENLANAALKLEKNKTEKSKSVKLGEKHKIIDNDSDNDYGNLEESIQGESDVDNEKNHKRHKHKHNKNSKHVSKKAKHNQNETRDSDSDQSGAQDIKDVEKYNSNFSDGKNKISKKSTSIEEKSCRRSHRLSSKMKDEMMNLDDPGEILEPDTAEQDSFYPADPECSSVEAQLIASRLCLCSHRTQVYISAANDDVVHCTAIDSIGDRLVGCNRVVDGNEIPMLRPSSRVPYIILCEVHLNRMLRHNCCPKCGLFCTQGRFAQCEAKHQYHRECQISVGDSECCPHCGLSTPEHDIFITMHSSKKPIFLPSQKPQYPSAKMNFKQIKVKKEDVKLQRSSLSPIIPASLIYSNSIQTATNDEKYDIDSLFQAIKEGDQEKVILILGSNSVSFNTPLEEFDGGTVLHYAALNGILPIIHILVMAGVELDILDKEQNTALVCAILAFKNDIVKYLIKAGASITLKGTDGMTALHISAKSGNLTACELLLDVLSGKKGYVDTADDGGWTPLVWACEHGHFEVVMYLIHKGADPLLRDVEQNVALHWAAFSGSANIAELLLNNKSDVNAINAHGDSPLHIAARQNMYGCILILLARGADVNVVNKAGEAPLDCTKPMSDCYSAISLNVQLQALTTSENKLQYAILTNDISRGREANPVQCVNSVDDEQKPTDFVYISENCITSDFINIDRKISTMHLCSCEEKCMPFNCLCCNNSLRCWYDEEGKLLADFNYLDPPMIFECNQLCNCNAITCNNRVVQHGLTQRFQLFKTEMKGWGIRTLRNIAKGTYVCEYIGEIIADTEADRREDDSYIFDLDSRDSESFCIDAKQYGNFARFINHSCEPNLIPIRVFIEHHDLRFPRIAFFANRDILAEEELSFDYGERFWIVKYKSFTCDCGSLNCKYSEETIATTIENYNKKLQEEVV